MVELRVLGAIEAHAGGRSVVPAGPRQRAVLAALLVEPGRTVSEQRLVDAVWGTDPPASARNSLQSHIARLRAALRDLGVDLQRGPGGYRLPVPPESVDAYRFARAVTAALGEADDAAALRLLEDALDGWGGSPYEGVDNDVVTSEAARLQELHRTAVDERGTRLLRLGRAAEAVAVLRGALAEDPLRELTVALLMRALYADGRHAEALQAARDHRRLLEEDLGLEPSAELRAMETAILRHELPAPAATGSKGAAAARVPPSAPPPGAPAPRTRLPVPVTSLIGRESDVAAGRVALSASRLVTLVGPGGVGKTRLAIAVAGGLAASYADGAVWVDLAAVGASEDVPRVVAAALGAHGQPGRDIADVVVDRLAAGEALLVVDNCEHVLDTAAPLLEAVARWCPHVAVLATSRERLAVDGERVVPVAPLRVAPAGAPHLSGAERLFRDRAVAAGLPLAGTVGERRLVHDICAALDGLPLAVELAAARAPALGLRVVAERLGSLDVLATRSRSSVTRHRTLRAVIDWGYDLLDGYEQRLFAALGVFAGGFDLAAVEGVCAGPALPAARIGTLLTSLVDRSMVVAPDAAGRYRLLDTLRSYARERLADDPHGSAVADRHLRYVVRLLEEVAAGERTAEEACWARRCADLLPDARSALSRAVASGDLDSALGVLLSLHDHSYWRLAFDVLAWAEDVARMPTLDRHPSAAIVHASLAIRATYLQGYAAAAGHVDAALRAADPAGGPAAAARAYEAAGDVALFAGRLADAEQLYAEGADAADRAGDAVYSAMDRANVALCRGYAERDDAVALAEGTVATARTIGNPTLLGMTHYVRAECRAGTDPEGAQADFDAAVGYARQAENTFLDGIASIGSVALRGRVDAPREALVAYRDVLEHWRRQGNRVQALVCLRNLAELLSRIGCHEDAVALAAAADAAPTATVVYGAQRGRLDGLLAAARERVGDDAAAGASARGSSLGYDAMLAAATDAIARALDGTGA